LPELPAKVADGADFRRPLGHEPPLGRRTALRQTADADRPENRLCLLRSNLRCENSSREQNGQRREGVHNPCSCRQAAFNE
jgi:hypothetical protein